MKNLKEILPRKSTHQEDCGVCQSCETLTGECDDLKGIRIRNRTIDDCHAKLEEVVEEIENRAILKFSNSIVHIAKVDGDAAINLLNKNSELYEDQLQAEVTKE